MDESRSDVHDYFLLLFFKRRPTVKKKSGVEFMRVSHLG
jgi:hypothetical protein